MGWLGHTLSQTTYLGLLPQDVRQAIYLIQKGTTRLLPIWRTASCSRTGRTASSRRQSHSAHEGRHVAVGRGGLPHLYRPHLRLYPLHHIIDSLENITHSLCNLEFKVRRESYYWLLWAFFDLSLYRLDMRLQAQGVKVQPPQRHQKRAVQASSAGQREVRQSLLHPQRRLGRYGYTPTPSPPSAKQSESIAMPT